MNIELLTLNIHGAWQDNPEASVYNREGLPASPFRTDNWSELNRPR